MNRPLLAAAVMALALAASSTALADGQEIFANRCATCHGSDGKGKTKMGDKLKIKDLSATEAQKKLTDEAIIEVVKSGVADKATGRPRMPAYKDKLTEDEIKSLVAVVRSLRSTPAP